MPGDRPYTPEEMALMTPGDVASMAPDALRMLLMQRLAMQQAPQPQAQQQAPQAPQQQGPAPIDDLEFLSFLTPERRAENAAMGTLDEQGQQLEGQLAAAQALQNRATAQRGTLGGAIGSGLGGVVDALRGGLQEKDTRAQIQALLKRKDAGRAAYQDDLARFRLQQQQRVAPGLGMADMQGLPPGVG